MFKSMPPIPHTYSPGFPAAYIKEYARRYKVLWAVKNGLPVSPKLDWHNYINYLGLLGRDDDGKLFVTPKGEEIYFTRQEF